MINTHMPPPLFSKRHNLINFPKPPFPHPHSDPYVRIDVNQISGDATVLSKFTKTKKRTLHPKWNEEFILRVNPAEHKLVLQVFDENRLTRDDFLGMVELSLDQLPKERPGVEIPIRSYPLRPRRSVRYA